MNRLGPIEMNPYVGLAEDRRQALRAAAEAYRLARLAQSSGLSPLQRGRLQLGRLLVKVGRRLMADLDQHQAPRPFTLAR